MFLMIGNIIILLLVLVMAVLGLRYYTHMLQLSSYQFQGYFRFLRSIPRNLVAHGAVLLATVAALIADKAGVRIALIALIIFIALYVFLIFIWILI